MAEGVEHSRLFVVEQRHGDFHGVGIGLKLRRSFVCQHLNTDYWNGNFHLHGALLGEVG